MQSTNTYTYFKHTCIHTHTYIPSSPASSPCLSSAAQLATLGTVHGPPDPDCQTPPPAPPCKDGGEWGRAQNWSVSLARHTHATDVTVTGALDHTHLYRQWLLRKLIRIHTHTHTHAHNSHTHTHTHTHAHTHTRTTLLLLLLVSLPRRA